LARNEKININSMWYQKWRSRRGHRQRGPSRTAACFDPFHACIGHGCGFAFRARRCLAKPLTSFFQILYALPLESPDSERARTHLIVREPLLRFSPFCTCLPLTRTLSVPLRTFTLHAYPSNTPSHAPQRAHQSPRTNARGLRAVLTSYLLLYTTLKQLVHCTSPQQFAVSAMVQM
jgi:hypothetical protein